MTCNYCGKPIAQDPVCVKQAGRGRKFDLADFHLECWRLVWSRVDTTATRLEMSAAVTRLRGIFSAAMVDGGSLHK